MARRHVSSASSSRTTRHGPLFHANVVVPAPPSSYTINNVRGLVNGPAVFLTVSGLSPVPHRLVLWKSHDLPGMARLGKLFFGDAPPWARSCMWGTWPTA